MNVRQFSLLLLIVLTSVTFMAIAWEFWAEDILGPYLLDEFEPEDRAERWEYVISIALFAALSLIYPLIFGKRLIEKQEQLTEEIRNLSEIDHLTEMYNRRKITELFDSEYVRYKRYRYPLSIMIIDIDFFKKINDEHGHNQGDITLKEIASILKREVRESDHVGRWGGEEFLVICPETDIDGAYTLAEKLRKTISEYPFSNVGHKTASFGVTTCSDDCTFENMINRADKALYTAKSGGRNNVVQLV
jgi:diguanylate cyclase (GGDEF)-like protein